MAEDPRNATETLQTMRGTAERLRHGGRAPEERVTIGEVADGFGTRSFGPVLILLPLVELSPLGGVPLVPSFLALLVGLTAAQMLLGRKHLWLPGVIADRSVSADKVEAAADKMMPLARRLDRWFRGRLERLTEAWALRLAAVLIIAMMLAVPVLELVPFATSVPMLAVLALGLAGLVHDGLLMLTGLVIGAASLGGVAWLVLRLAGG